MVLVVVVGAVVEWEGEGGGRREMVVKVAMGSYGVNGEVW